MELEGTRVLLRPGLVSINHTPRIARNLHNCIIYETINRVIYSRGFLNERGPSAHDLSPGRAKNAALFNPDSVESREPTMFPVIYQSARGGLTVAAEPVMVDRSIY